MNKTLWALAVVAGLWGCADTFSQTDWYDHGINPQKTVDYREHFVRSISCDGRIATVVLESQDWIQKTLEIQGGTEEEIQKFRNRSWDGLYNPILPKYVLDEVKECIQK